MSEVWRRAAAAAMTVSQIAAGGGAFFLLCSLAEAPSLPRIEIELALIAPYAAVALASACLHVGRSRRRRKFSAGIGSHAGKRRLANLRVVKLP